MSLDSKRRHLMLAAAGLVGGPALATGRRPLASMTEGPFYPPRAWREHWPDADADLSRVRQRDGSTLAARGEPLGLEGQVLDSAGRVIDDAEVEIWQCDALAQYRHPSVAQRSGEFDPGFQGFGASRSDKQGRVRFRTIRPVPYPGRTPHIHITLRHASFGELTSQLFVAGDPGNERDFLWRQLRAPDRSALAMALQPAPADSGLRWVAQHLLVVPA